MYYNVELTIVSLIWLEHLIILLSSTVKILFLVTYNLLIPSPLISHALIVHTTLYNGWFCLESTLLPLPAKTEGITCFSSILLLQPLLAGLLVLLTIFVFWSGMTATEMEIFLP